jgi:predicted nucleic acid-binding Zn ribbon protein
MVYEGLCYSGIGWDANSLLFDIGGIMTEEEVEEECRKIIEKRIKREERAFKIDFFITKNAKTIAIIGWVIAIVNKRSKLTQ